MYRPCYAQAARGAGNFANYWPPVGCFLLLDCDWGIALAWPAS